MNHKKYAFVLADVAVLMHPCAVVFCVAVLLFGVCVKGMVMTQNKWKYSITKKKRLLVISGMQLLSLLK
jgi:hypothetical protein